MSLKCAVQLGIPDAIHNHGKPITLAELVDALSINKAKSRGLYRLMRILVHSKFFEKNDEEGYSLTRASRLLLRDEPLSMAPFALALLDPVIMDPFRHLSEWFQNEHPTPFETKYGKSIWEYTGIDPKWSEAYYEGLACDAPFVASVLVKECKHVFEGLSTMVDVGGGTGMVAKGIADAIPNLKCIVLDLPHVVDGLKGYHNLSFVGGDMFESIPHADAVFLKWNLSMWSHEECVKLLGNCKKAINPSKIGKVIIVEMILDDEREDELKTTETHLFFDMHVMTRFAGGGERTKEEWEKLFFAAGFTSYKINPILGLRSMIEVFP